MIKKSIVLFVLSVLTISFAYAQVNTSSPYSRFGIGDIESDVLGRGKSMGGISTGLRLPMEINTTNPASYSAIPQKVFLFQVGVKAQRTDYSVTNDQITNYDFGLTSINAAFGLQKFWSMSFGLNPVSSIGYKVYTEDSVSLNGYTSNFQNTYVGEGGLSRIYFGNALSYKGFSAGVNVSYIFGTVQNRTESVLYEVGFSTYFSDLENTRIKGLNLRYGLQYNDSIFKKYQFVLGGYYENQMNLNADLIKSTVRIMAPQSDITISDTLFNDTTVSGKFAYPSAFGFGFSFMSKKMIIGADYSVTNWDDAEIFNEKFNNLTNNSRIAFGLEYTNNYTSKKYLDVINFRIGAYLDNSHISINGTQIKKQGVTFGFGFPTKLGAKFNVGFEIGQRGTIDNDLIKENYYGVNLNFNFSDNWFVRRKFF
jgi:hypothetical protein